MSRGPDSLFKKFVIMTKFPIRFYENLPNLMLLLFSEQELWHSKNLGGKNPPSPPPPRMWNKVNNAVQNVKMQSLKFIFIQIYFKRKYYTVKNPHDHILGGVPGLNSPSLESRQIKREKSPNERCPETRSDPGLESARGIN